MEGRTGTALNLYYHAVSGRAQRPEDVRPGRVSASALGDRLERLLAEGLEAAPLGRYRGASKPGPGSFTVSFDDASPSVIEHAVPVLRELRVPATMFVPALHPGETDLVLGWREIASLATLPGWTIGSHGGDHGRAGWRLYDESPEDQLARLERDARESRTIIGRRTGTIPDLYAYPFGEAPAVAREAVKRAGYSAAFTVAATPEWGGDTLTVPRVDGTLDGAGRARDVGISVVVPACDRIENLREVIRRLLGQSYPADRYEVIVVDDGSRIDLASALGGSLAGNPRVLRLDGSDGTFRAGQARQRGADAARFEIVAFLDADVAVDRDYLWHVAWCHGRDERTVALGYLSGYNLHDRGWVHGRSAIAREERLSGDLVPVIPDRSREPALRACLDDIDSLPEPWKLAYTGNMSVPRSLLARAGGFSRELTGWGFEDVDLGIRLHRLGARFRFSRWAIGYHIDDVEGGGTHRASNPFRDPAPSRGRFDGVLANLAALERLHPGDREVRAFCDRVRSDVAEICEPPRSVGVEMGADYPFDWPFARLHAPHPGGVPLGEILDRLAYARKLGVRHLYLLGGDVAMSPHLAAVLDEARAGGFGSVTIETTAITLASGEVAHDLARRGLGAAVVDVLAGEGHPAVLPGDPAAAGVHALARAGVVLGARIVLGSDDASSFDRALVRCADLGLDVRCVTVVGLQAPAWLAGTLPRGSSVEVAP